MLVKHVVFPALSTDDEGKQKLIALDEVLSTVSLKGFKEASIGHMALLAGVPTAIPFASVAVGWGLFLLADGDFALAVDGGADIPVKRGKTGDTAVPDSTSARVLAEFQTTSLAVTAVADCTLTFAVWGDP